MYYTSFYALAGLLSNKTYPGGSLPRDFVELPSQIMEHWVLEPEVLKVYAKHYQTDEIIPAEIVEKLEKSGKFNTGFQTVEYLAASLLDMEYHSIKEPIDLDIRDFENKAMAKYGLIPEIKPRYRSTYFNHIWAGGYSAGYYGYIWCEILDADAFQAFKETGNIFNKDIAAKFEKEILARGGTRDPLDMYIAFRGKEPGIDALLLTGVLNNQTLHENQVNLFFLFSSLSNLGAKTSDPVAVKGILDLSEISNPEHFIIKLNGEWEFYWNKMLHPHDFNGVNIIPDYYGKVPSYWTDYPQELVKTEKTRLCHLPAYSNTSKKV